MSILVAGGAGFIGSHVCAALLGRGHSVVCVDNLSTGTAENVRELEHDPRFHFLESDVAETPVVPVDRILHLASPASPVDYERSPLETMAANALGTWRLLQVARQTSASLTFVSTSEIYGDALVHPQPEAYWGNTDPVGPRSCYAESKRFGEALVFAYRRAEGVRANVVRVFNTYGPRMRHGDGRVIPEMLAAAFEGRPLIVHGDGRQTRSFCYVSDLVEALLHVTLDPEVDGEIFNLGNPGEITVRELAETIRGLVRPDAVIQYVERRTGDPERRRPAIAKVQGRYGWSPRVTLERGLRMTAESFAAERGRMETGAA
jgi:nucleoside-diphosphate-sugar epimerase